MDEPSMQKCVWERDTGEEMETAARGNMYHFSPYRRTSHVSLPKPFLRFWCVLRRDVFGTCSSMDVTSKRVRREETGSRWQLGEDGKMPYSKWTGDCGFDLNLR